LQAKAVLRVEVVPDAQPEHVVRLVPWTSVEPTKSEPFRLPPEQARGRPLRLLGIPQPIQVTSIVPDGPPIHMAWQGQDCVVVRAWGPERIATGWWRAEDIQRDYYRAEWEQGTQVWVYRDQRTGRWFLHGFFD
jgi:protein ImuB